MEAHFQRKALATHRCLFTLAFIVSTACSTKVLSQTGCIMPSVLLHNCCFDKNSYWCTKQLLSAHDIFFKRFMAPTLPLDQIHSKIINPRWACASRVTVVVLWCLSCVSVCVSVCVSLCPFSVFYLLLLLGVQQEVSAATQKLKTKKPFSLKLLSSKVMCYI